MEESDGDSNDGVIIMENSVAIYVTKMIIIMIVMAAKRYFY